MENPNPNFRDRTRTMLETGRNAIVRKQENADFLFKLAIIDHLDAQGLKLYHINKKVDAIKSLLESQKKGL